MPNLPMHIYMAQQSAQELDWGFAFDHMGSFFLGSTAPDIRAMTKWPRERTHFSKLSVAAVGEGTRRMFQLHPELSDISALKPSTRAFVLGYVSHLASDEVWITSMFRPHFDPEPPASRVTDSDVETHIWDRALQLDMDRRVTSDMNGFETASREIDCSDPGIDIGFLAVETLQEWRTWVQWALNREFSWERLKRALNRMYRDNEAVQFEVDRFLENIPYSMEKVYEKIPEQELTAYQERAVAGTVALAREFFVAT